MKKVIRLTESDLVKIVNKVIEEQKITDKGPIAKKIEVPYEFGKSLGINFNKIETDKSFIDKIKDAKIGISGFYIQSEGWNFPVFPAYGIISTKKGDFRLSFEPANQENGKYMLRWTKKFGT